MAILNTLSFDEIYSSTYENVLKYVVCNTRNIDDVNDIIQNIYLALYKVLDKGKDIDDINKYLYKIMHNKVKDYYRFKYGHSDISLEEDMSREDCQIDKLIINKDNIDFIWSYLKNKNIIIFKIFYLHFYFGLSLKEVAKALDLKESNVKTMLYRNISILNGLLKKEV